MAFLMQAFSRSFAVEPALLSALLAAEGGTGLAGRIASIAMVALGLGLVILFHEFGHFAVAKWCDVKVECFSIGFGPAIWKWRSRKGGETEYRLSWLPFGGYVKMLGQDDLDASQMTSEEIARDPRSYMAKSVWQRMAIISAGVVMNIVTGMLFFATAFGIGTEQMPSIVGGTVPGSPAWQAGLRAGDRIRRIDRRPIESFQDLTRGVMLTDGGIRVAGTRRDGQSTFDALVVPEERRKGGRMMGVAPLDSLRIVAIPGSTATSAKPAPSAAEPDSPAAKADPGFLDGDEVRRIDDRDVADHPALMDALAERAERAVVLHVRRAGGPETDLVPIKVPAQPFRTLGLWTDIGKITAVQPDSPAARAGMLPGDRIAEIDGKKLGTDFDPLRLPDYLAGKAGTVVLVGAVRQAPGADPQRLEFRFAPRPIGAWANPPRGKDHPLAASSAGFAFHLIPTVLKVQPGGPADKAGLRETDRIRSIEFVRPEGAPPDLYKDAVVAFETVEEAGAVKLHNWACAFWFLQEHPGRTVRLVVEGPGGPRTVEVVPQEEADWFVPGTRGLLFRYALEMQQATGAGEAIRLGLHHTRSNLGDLYLMLRKLWRREVPADNLQGPVQIFGIALFAAEKGVADLLLFLGFLSMNLAVLNFLPVPALDGGHMVFLTWEAVTRRKPSANVLKFAQLVGVVLLVSLMAYVLFKDIYTLSRGG